MQKTVQSAKSPLFVRSLNQSQGETRRQVQEKENLIPSAHSITEEITPAVRQEISDIWYFVFGIGLVVLSSF